MSKTMEPDLHEPSAGIPRPSPQKEWKHPSDHWMRGFILDEPTTALSLTETAKVFHFVRQVRASGRSILFIGHNIHHVFDIADRFVVIDRGKVALTADRTEVKSAEELINFMEDVAHPGGLAGLHDAGDAERAVR